MPYHYFDHNASTPVAESVLSAMLPFFREQAGNPSSWHASGQVAKHAVDEARSKLAALLHCQSAEIAFTSGGTEANNWALWGLAREHDFKGHIITATSEHPAVLEVCRALEREGVAITCLPVNRQGLVEPASLEAALRADTFLVSIMLANNETGVVQPIAALAELAHRRGVLFHADAVQGVGKIPVHVGNLGVDLLSLSGHKFGAPKGVGALYIRQGIQLRSLIVGGGQESGRRAGTTNVAGVVGLGAAAELAATRQVVLARKMRSLAEQLLIELQQAFTGLRVVSDLEHGLPNTLNLGIPGVDGERLMLELDLAGFAVSRGSACALGERTPSHVLLAMGLSHEEALEHIRISLGPEHGQEEIMALARAMAQIVKR
jgi:cysteine desulfurase